MRLKIFHLMFGFVLGAVLCPAQARVGNGVPVSDVDERILLEKYQIASTSDGLLTALRHPRSDVRSFAALKLAADGQKGALPSILAALATEPIQGVQTNLALAAARLGAEDGVNALRNICQDQQRSASLRMSAAQAILSLEREECLGGVLEVLRASANDQQAVVQALFLLPRFKHLEAEEVQEIRSLIGTSLKSSFPTVRMGASNILREIGGSSATEYLKAAMAVERDDAVRRVMGADLAAVAR